MVMSLHVCSIFPIFESVEFPVLTHSLCCVATLLIFKVINPDDGSFYSRRHGV